MMLNPEEIVDDNMVVEGYEEIAVDDMNELVQNEDNNELTYVDDEVRSEEGDGYGGMPIDQYNDIVEYKRTGITPNNVEKRLDRSAPSHWRAKCNRFTLADDNETLLYINPTSPIHDHPKIVVKKGEVRKALERIHEIIGHLGQKRTQMVVLRKLYWRSVRSDVRNYIMSCDFCNQKKIEGRKVVKAPVDITSENFDINVSTRPHANGEDRLVFQLIGYNEQEVREAAYTRMTSYTFKETASEYRSRFTMRDPPMPAFRRQPYVKRNGDVAIGYLLPFQQRGKTVEPEFIEIYERPSISYGMEGEEFEQVVEEIVEPIGEGRIKRDHEQGGSQDAHPVTLDGELIQNKKFFKEEEHDEDVDVGHPVRPEDGNNKLSIPKKDDDDDRDDNQQHQQQEQRIRHDSTTLRAPTRISPKNMSSAPRMATRYGGKRSVVTNHGDESYAQQDHDHQGTSSSVSSSGRQQGRSGGQESTPLKLSNKRRRREPMTGIDGMAGRFSMAIGELDRMDNNDSRNNQQQLGYEGSSGIQTEFHGLPPVCMMPSLDPVVISMQKELLQRQIRIQKLQEKMLESQYAASMRIPMTRYIQQTEVPEEDIIQEDGIVVDHEMDVIDGHPVYSSHIH